MGMSRRGIRQVVYLPVVKGMLARCRTRSTVGRWVETTATPWRASSARPVGARDAVSGAVQKEDRVGGRRVDAMKGGRATQRGQECVRHCKLAGQSRSARSPRQSRSTSWSWRSLVERASREVVCSASANGNGRARGRGDLSQQMARDWTQWPGTDEGARGNAPREQRWRGIGRAGCRGQGRRGWRGRQVFRWTQGGQRNG